MTKEDTNSQRYSRRDSTSSDTTYALDAQGVISKIRNLTAIGEETQRELDSVNEVIEKAVTSTKESIMQTGSLIQDLKSSVTERDAGYLRSALARVPIVRSIPGISSVADYMSLKDSLEQSYHGANEGIKRLEALISPFEGRSEEIDARIREILQRRQEAESSISQLQQKINDIDANYTGLEVERAKYEEGSDAYQSIDDQLTLLEIERRSVGRDLRSQDAIRNTAQESVQFLRAQSITVDNYVGELNLLVTTGKKQLEIVEPCIQEQAQLAQLSDAAEKVSEQLVALKTIANTAAIAQATKGAIIGRIVHETTGTPFYLPEVVEATKRIGERGQEWQERQIEDLREETTSAVGNELPIIDVTPEYKTQDSEQELE